MNLIVAVDSNWGIGKDNQLLYHYKEDMILFKNLTLYNVVIMGKNTLLSLPNEKPLEDRINIVLTHDFDFEKKHVGVKTVYNLSDLFSLIDDVIHSTSWTTENIWVIGGGEIYRQLLPYCEKAYVTQSFDQYEADTFFPNLDEEYNWKCKRIQISKMYRLKYYIYENKDVKEFKI